jgi:non-homologous end joining protein Ku
LPQGVFAKHGVGSKGVMAKPQAEEGGEVVDLMAALRESVEKTQKKGSRSRKRARKAS